MTSWCVDVSQRRLGGAIVPRPTPNSGVESGAPPFSQVVALASVDGPVVVPVFFPPAHAS